MKKILFLLLFTGCKLIAQDATYKVTWDYNEPVESVTSYNVFLIALSDTTLTPFHAGMDAETVRQYQIASPTEASLKAINPDYAVFSFVQQEDGRYIHAAVSAVNTKGESVIGVSFCYKKAYNLVPSMVRTIKVNK